MESSEALTAAIVDAERTRLFAILHVTGAWGTPERTLGVLHCPVCGADVRVALRPRHIDWHLRCLQ